jgi:hypothetical protein
MGVCGYADAPLTMPAVHRIVVPVVRYGIPDMQQKPFSCGKGRITRNRRNCHGRFIILISFYWNDISLHRTRDLSFSHHLKTHRFRGDIPPPVMQGVGIEIEYTSDAAPAGSPRPAFPGIPMWPAVDGPSNIVSVKLLRTRPSSEESPRSRILSCAAHDVP